MPATISNRDLAAYDLVAAADCHRYGGTRMNEAAQFPRRPPYLVFSKSGLSPPYGNRSTYGAGTGASGVIVVARLDDPHSVFFPYNLADVMRPNHHRADAGRPGMTPARPVPRKIVFGARIVGYKLPHLPTTPSAWTPSVAVVSLWRRVSVSAASGVMMHDATMRMNRPGLSRLRKQERCHENGH
jgi:hypothetical protein